MRRAFALLLALALWLVPQLAMAEEVYVLPEPGSFSYEHSALINEEDAIAAAKLLWNSNFFLQSTDGGTWAAFEDGEGHWYVYGRYADTEEAEEGYALVMKLRASDGAPVEAENGLVYQSSEILLLQSSYAGMGEIANAELSAYLIDFQSIAAPEYDAPLQFIRELTAQCGEEQFPGYSAPINTETGMGFNVRLQLSPYTRIVAFEFPFG